MSSVIRQIKSFIWTPFQIGASFSSYLFVCTMRKLLQNMNKEGGHLLPGKHDFPSWQGWSQIQVQPWRLPYMMIVAPRWNPHAVQHHLYPLQVNSEISIHVETARRSAKEWIISIFKHGREVKSLASMECTDPGPWHSITVTPGTYIIFLRYYNWDKKGECPAVKIDNDIHISSVPIVPEIDHYEEFMSNLKNRRNGFYWFLHCFVYNSLRWQRYLSAKFVRKAYLPFGNPRTIFYYGLLEKGEILQIDYPQSLSEKASLYLVVLDTCSFPLFWLTLSKNRFKSDEMPRNGTYLVRVVYRNLSDYRAAVRNEEYCNDHTTEGKYKFLSIRDNVN